MKNIETIYERIGNWCVLAEKYDNVYKEVKQKLETLSYSAINGYVYKYYGVKNGNLFFTNKSFGKILTSKQVWAMLEDLPKVGETVEVRDGVGEAWMEAVFYTKINHGSYPYIAQSSGANYPVAWRYMRRKQEVLEVIVKKNGKQVDASCISEETWANLRKA